MKDVAPSAEAIEQTPPVQTPLIQKTVFLSTENKCEKNAEENMEMHAIFRNC